MQRPKATERTWELDRKSFVLTLNYWWPPERFMKLTCFVWGHEDIWEWRYAPNLARCGHCGKDLSWQK